MTKDKSETGYCTMQDTCVWKRKSEHVQVYSCADSLASSCVMCNGERVFYRLSSFARALRVSTYLRKYLYNGTCMRNKHNVQIKTKT